MESQRHILHVDMDAFFAAIEQRDRPELRGRPVLVGGSPTGRGVVAAASYEARPFGCHSALPMRQALQRCPQAVVVRGDMQRYKQVSQQVFAVLADFTPTIEPLSVDEAFLDVAGTTRLFGPPATIADRIKQRIYAELRLTASVGVAPNKFLAKLASDLDKPDGLVVVPPDDVVGFLAPLPIARLWGAGKVTQATFARLGVRTFGDAQRLGEDQLVTAFGEHGAQFYRLVRGRDDRPVQPSRTALQISHEETFARDLRDFDRVRAILQHHTERVAARLRAQRRRARCVVLKIRDPAFQTLTRRRRLPEPTDHTTALWSAVASLFDAWRDERPAPVRLIGVGVTDLTTGGDQLELFTAPADERTARLDQTIDAIRARFGPAALTRGNAVQPEER